MMTVHLLLKVIRLRVNARALHDLHWGEFLLRSRFGFAVDGIMDEVLVSLVVVFVFHVVVHEPALS